MKLKKNKTYNKIPKPILLLAKATQLISNKLAVNFAKKIFTTPIKYKLPKRELEMDTNTNQYLLEIPEINKQIMVYEYGNTQKKVLLVHGWSGRGTQLVKIADLLLKMGYSTISFDAPAHGKSPGNSSIMLDFIASIIELEKKYNQFDFAIGHSLGGMSVLNAIKKGLKLKKAVIIGSGDSINAILLDFVSKMKMKQKIAELMRISFEKDFNEPMEDYSGSNAAKNIAIPVLVVHDKNDDDVPYQASQNIHHNLRNSELYLTQNLGHRKILGDHKVLQKIESFLS